MRFIKKLLLKKAEKEPGSQSSPETDTITRELLNEENGI